MRLQKGARRSGYFSEYEEDRKPRDAAAFLRDEVLANVGHAQWGFSIPRMPRP
jgi:hypothetical protein